MTVHASDLPAEVRERLGIEPEHKPKTRAQAKGPGQPMRCHTCREVLKGTEYALRAHQDRHPTHSRYEMETE